MNNVKKDLASKNLSGYDYYILIEKGNKLTILEAGTDAKIGRNAYSLQPSF